jgi:hypothetical protein
MEWQDVAAALNKLTGAMLERDAQRAEPWFRERGYVSVEFLPDTEAEHDAALWEHGVPPELIGRAGQLLAPGPVVYQHVVGPVHPYLHFEPGPIGGQQ